ncbi:MAG: type II toxin-antitoxin system VapC family toxin [Lachnospiraceae bacterium]|nr:type II toxin-antitoxin system VapC family toxin [Lachnospiraceae bacterium]
MKYLLDTNVLLWVISGNEERVSSEIYDILNDSANDIYYSMASVWEVGIKYIKNPKLMEFSPENFVKLCDKLGFIRLSINCDHIYTLKDIKLAEGAPDHKDPFDRLIMSQAKYENMIMITGDLTLRWYNLKNMIFINEG